MIRGIFAQQNKGANKLNPFLRCSRIVEGTDKQDHLGFLVRQGMRRPVNQEIR